MANISRANIAEWVAEPKRHACNIARKINKFKRFTYTRQARREQSVGRGKARLVKIRRIGYRRNNAHFTKTYGFTRVAKWEIASVEFQRAR